MNLIEKKFMRGSPLLQSLLARIQGSDDHAIGGESHRSRRPRNRDLQILERLAVSMTACVAGDLVLTKVFGRRGLRPPGAKAEPLQTRRRPSQAKQRMLAPLASVPINKVFNEGSGGIKQNS